MQTLSFDVVIPDYVQFIAMDANGNWYGYGSMPYIDEEHYMWQRVEGDNFDFLCHLIPSRNWREELYEIVR